MINADPTNHAADEPEVTDFEAIVEGVTGTEVRLDRTYFYAEGGGQPPDRGTLAGLEVVDVQTVDGGTVHTLASEPDVVVGETVEATIDSTVRTYVMRAHTASHVVFGAARRLVDDVGYGGFDIGQDSVRLDFEIPGSAAEIDGLTLQRLASEAVWESRQVEWYDLPVADARSDPDVVFNVDVGAETEAVRIVEIEDWDIAACGGTHVRNTGEIGPIVVSEVSNPGADLVRVTFSVGPAAIQRQADVSRRAKRAANALDVSVDDLPERAEQVRSEVTSLQSDHDSLRERLLEARLAALDDATVTRNGEEWLVGTVDAVGPGLVADRLDPSDVDADVVVVTGVDGATFVVAGANGDTDAASVVETVTDEFGGGGGGSGALAQGGGIEADPADVVEYVRES